MVPLRQSCGSFRVEGSGRFLKKAAQKFLFLWAMGVVTDKAHGPALIKFFCFFLFTKRSLPLPSSMQISGPG
jgi:hypothetical protein